VWTWTLAASVVLYLGLDGGGYDVVVRSQVGTVLWWIVLVCAAWGILPASRLTRSAWAALALFGGFVAWTALASTWSLSSERSLQELSRVACYLAILLIAVSIHRDRERAVRQTVDALGASIVIVAALAVTSRLVPGSFPAAHLTAVFLPGVRGRLSWPLNYWNGLAALIALGLPLLLSIACSARTLPSQAAAAASLPLLAMCGYLTFSRGGAIASAVAVGAFLILAPDRLPKLATTLVAGLGGAVAIAGVIHRNAVDQGLTNHSATVQGKQLLVTIVLVCAAVAVAQVGIGLGARHGTLPRALRLSRRRAAGLLAAGIVVAAIGGLAAGVPSRLSHAWSDFKRQRTTQALQARFGTTAGNGRYDMWKVAVDSTSGHLLGGSGPGTFQLVWQPRAPYDSYVINAHSLYFETLAELGVVGLALLVAFVGLVLAAAVRLVTRSQHEARTRAAGAAAALLAFAVSALADWVWQLPVLPAAFLLLAGAVLAPPPVKTSIRAITAAGGFAAQSVRSGRRLAVRSGLVAAALACLIAIAVPLATAVAVRQSQTAAQAGNNTLALSDARAATRIEPDAASGQLQVALVLELLHDLPGALHAAIQATHDEPQNWNAWLVVSRLEAESGHALAAVAAYRRARSLNPRSPLFQT
jgi:hypothetical protein